MPDPTPLEERLEAALDDRATRVDTDTHDLLTGARERASARRRRTTVLAAGGSVAAVVLAAVALPGLMPDRTRTEPTPANDPAPALTRGKDLRTAPDGWRQVVYRDLTFAVPLDWGNGAVDQYCIGDGQPVVQLPGTAQTEVACTPLRGLGVVVTPPDQTAPLQNPGDYADGTSLAQETKGRWTVTVSAGSAKVRDQVAASIRLVADGDWVNGCPAHLDVPDLGSAVVGAEEGAVSVCRYAVGVDGPNLDATWTAADVGPATTYLPPSLEPLRAAPKGSGPDAGPGTCDDWPEDSAVALVGDRGPTAWIHFTGCGGHGVDLGGGDTRRLTEQVMLVATMAPWSGGTIGEVPMPGMSGDRDGSVSSDG